MSRTQDQLEFFTFGPSDNYIRRHPEAAPGEIDSVARVLDGMEPDAKEIVRRYNAHEDLVNVLNRILSWNRELPELPPELESDAKEALEQTDDYHPDEIITK